MNQPLRRALAAEMLAYVDGCLPREKRQAVEIAMSEHPEVQGQIDEWLSQNEAIRTAFAEPPAAVVAAASSRPAAPKPVAASASRRSETLRGGEDPGRQWRSIERAAERVPGRHAGAPASAPPRRDAKRRGPAAARRFLLLAFAGALAFWGVSAEGAREPRVDFAAAAAAAYRTFSGNQAHPVEFATSDRGVLERWFAAQTGRAAPVPDFTAAGLALVGGRIVPGAASRAQFMLYENGHRQRIGVVIEALDAPPETPVVFGQSGAAPIASWTSAGRGFTVAGEAPGVAISQLTALVRGSNPTSYRGGNRFLMQ